MVRRPYTTDCRFFSNSSQTVKIKWYPALPEAGTLGFPSRIQSLDWCSEPWFASGVGEVFDRPRNYNYARPVRAAKGEHVCGSQETFSVGERYDPSKPPQVYRPDGLPVCCVPWAGAAVGGGTAGVRFVAKRDGAIGGGTALVRFISARNGAVGGGTALVVFVPAGVSQTGGAVGGGAAGVALVQPVGQAGGAVGGGTATVTHADLINESGGAVGGGSAGVTSTAVVGQVGGAVGGGSAGVTSTAVVGQVGGAVGGGTAGVVLVQPVGQVGGAVGGGTATVIYVPPEVVGSGGAVGGGTATVMHTDLIDNRGGAVGGGAATVRAFTAEGYAMVYAYDSDFEAGQVTTVSPTDWTDGAFTLIDLGGGLWGFLRSSDFHQWYTTGWDGQTPAVFAPASDVYSFTISPRF